MVCPVARRFAGPLLWLPLVALGQQAPPATAESHAGSGGSASVLESIEVDSQRLNDARTGIQTQLGASVYTIDAAAIAAMPGGDNGLLNQALMQAPNVAQDSFGQLHVRGEHNGLQYRLNGIILPEGISGFGQSLDPRLISSMQLITGALPAEYGLRTAGIVDLTTKSGALESGGAVSLYGGTHGTLEPSIAYGGTSGRWQYYGSADGLVNKVGVESPDGSANPLHDRTRQTHAFGFLENVIDSSNRVSLIAGYSRAGFQIPDVGGLQPALGAVVDGKASYPSSALNETQAESTEFGVLSWQHSNGPWDLQSALTVRKSTLQFTPDAQGDLLFTGLAQNATRRNIAFDWQIDAAYQWGEKHTVRAGGYLQRDRSTSATSSVVLDLDTVGGQTTQSQFNILDSENRRERIESVYLQDEWRFAPALTLNYGLRYDVFHAYARGRQWSPRVNLVWKEDARTTVHAGYSRYFTPPPFELISSETLAKFTNAGAGPSVTQNDTPQAERANYFDIGASHNLSQEITLGLDSYYKRSINLLDEGQFGAPIILTPFNYASGRQYGVEATANYAGRDIAAYASLAWGQAMGRDIVSSQFNFSLDELRYIANNFISLDHEQKVTGSGGISYRWRDTRLSSDLLLGSGLRASQPLPDGSDIPNGLRLPYYLQWNLGLSHVYHVAAASTLTARVDVINVLDREYQIRNGTGVGVGAPQYGPRRGFFVGLSKSL